MERELDDRWKEARMSDLSALVEALRPRRKALAVLWEACTVECKRRVLVPEDVQYGFGDYYHPPTCSSCGGTGHVTRDAVGWPAGAVRGMLVAAAIRTRNIPPPGMGMGWFSKWQMCATRLSWNWADDDAALAAVLEAVRAVPEDGDAAGETK